MYLQAHDVECIFSEVSSTKEQSSTTPFYPISYSPPVVDYLGLIDFDGGFSSRGRIARLVDLLYIHPRAYPTCFAALVLLPDIFRC